MESEILTISSKGQISIPIKMRKEMNLKQGDKLVAYSFGDTIMLRVLTVPTHEEFMKALDQCREEAKKWGLTEEEVKKAIEQVRKEHM